MKRLKEKGGIKLNLFLAYVPILYPFENFRKRFVLRWYKIKRQGKMD